MSVAHRLNGYDKGTELIAFRHTIPTNKLHVARVCAGVPGADPDIVGSYPLTPNAARRLAAAIGVQNLNIDRCDWFLEPAADWSTIDAKRQAAGVSDDGAREVEP